MVVNKILIVNNIQQFDYKVSNRHTWKTEINMIKKTNNFTQETRTNFNQNKMRQFYGNFVKMCIRMYEILISF